MAAQNLQDLLRQAREQLNPQADEQAQTPTSEGGSPSTSSSPPPASQPARTRSGPSQNRAAQGDTQLGAGTVGGIVRDVAQGIRDLPRSVWRGTATAINETKETAEALTGGLFAWSDKNIGWLGPGDDGEFIQWHRRARQEDENTIPDALIPNESVSTTGQLVEGISQFLSGWFAFGGARAVAGGLLRRTVVAAARGAAVDATVWDEHEGRLSDLIESYPALENPVTAYLASDEDDSLWEGKFKLAVEGIVPGVAADLLFAGVSALKKTRIFRNQADQLDAAGRAAAETELTAAVDEQIAKALNDAENASFGIEEVEGGFAVRSNSTGEVQPQTFRHRAGAEGEAAVLNMLEREADKARSLPQLTDENVAAIRERAEDLLTDPDPVAVEQLLRGTDINFAHLGAGQDTRATVEAISDVLRETIHGKPEVLTNTNLIAQIKEWGLDKDPALTLAALRQQYKDPDQLAAIVVAGRVWVRKLGDDVSRLSTLVDGHPNSPEAAAQLANALDELFEFQALTKRSQRAGARSVQAGNIDVDDVLKNTDPAIDQVSKGSGSVLERELAQDGAEALSARLQKAALEGMTTDDIRILARQLRLADGDPGTILKLVKGAGRTEVAPKSRWRSGLDKLNEYRINALLSGPKTHAVNSISNTVFAFQNPIEFMWAGVRSGDRSLMHEGADLLTGNFLAMKDSWHAARKALLTAQNSIDPDAVTNELSKLNAIGGDIGTLTRTPARFLTAEDEFFKTMAYRSQVRAQALKSAREMGLTGAQKAEYVDNALEAAFRSDGSGTNSAALEYSRELTFTNALTEGEGAIVGTGRMLQKLVNDYPIGRLFLPFVRTPTRIIDQMAKRTPVLARFHKQVAEDLAAGGRRRAIAKARIGTGYLIYSTAAGLALQGRITGRGPSDQNLRAQWLETHQPYSIRVGDRWVEYRRLDPIMSPFGIVADIIAGSGEIKSDKELEDVIGLTVASVAGSLSSKTYLRGIVTAMDVMTSGSDQKMHDYLNQTAASFVPNLANSGNPDEFYREPRGLVDEIMTRVPGFSETLPPRRNIFGEPVLKAPGWANRTFNPFTVSRVQSPEDQVVWDELLKLGRAMPMPAVTALGTSTVRMDTPEYGTVNDLTPYDRMLQLMGQDGLSDDGQTLFEEVRELIQSEQWTDSSSGDDVYAVGGLKYKRAAALIQGARIKAFNKVLEEFPLLKEARINAIRMTGASLTGGESGIQRLEDQLNNGDQ